MTAENMGLTAEQEAEAKERAAKRLAAEVTEDFERRREARKSVESGWLLNMNFFSGNQYCDVSPFGGLVNEDKQFYWQSRRVFNHIAPTVESRLAKLEKTRPALTVRAFSDEDSDIKAAQIATGVLNYAQERIRFSDTVAKATLWSEVCGSAFYKVTWDEKGGRQVAVSESGAPVYEGEVSVIAVPPFEIFPDMLQADGLESVKSIIHAQVVTVDDIYERFGVEVKGSDVSDLTLMGYSEPTAGKLPSQSGEMRFFKAKNGVILIERYSMPTSETPNGRLEIVAGGKLLYAGSLPYKNGERGERVFPFVKQDCMRLPAAFFGNSIIDRLIPVQRAYNAVRNRKHEFLNRLSMGVLTVEDGSVDVDELAEEGLLPGKVLVYRQGGKAPEMLDCGSVPTEFAQEESWLEREFSMISGVSELSENSTPARVTSATGLQLLLSQDESRLSATMGSIERATQEVGRQILRLYREFAGNARLMTMTGENKKTQVHYFNAAELTASDVRFETQEAVTPEEKKATLLKLYEAGLLTDEDGNLTRENKHRILEAFGFGSYENVQEISALHIGKAGEENLEMKKRDVGVDEYDDHALHISEHTRFLLSAEFKKLGSQGNLDLFKERYCKHIALHKQAQKQELLDSVKMDKMTKTEE